MINDHQAHTQLNTESETGTMAVDAKVIPLVKNEKIVTEIERLFIRKILNYRHFDSIQRMEKYYQERLEDYSDEHFREFYENQIEKIDVFKNHLDSVYEEILSLLQQIMSEKMEVIEQEMAKGGMIIWAESKKPAYLTKQEIRDCIYDVLRSHFSLRLSYK